MPGDFALERSLSPYRKGLSESLGKGLATLNKAITQYDAKQEDINKWMPAASGGGGSCKGGETPAAAAPGLSPRHERMVQGVGSQNGTGCQKPGTSH